MTFNWKEHAECRAKPGRGYPYGTVPCETDRAAMIAEGERLEREIAKWEVRCSAHRALGLTDMADLQAENARLETHNASLATERNHWRVRSEMLSETLRKIVAHGLCCDGSHDCVDAIEAEAISALEVKP
jgi:hypothetical protein